MGTNPKNGVKALLCKSFVVSFLPCLVGFQRFHFYMHLDSLRKLSAHVVCTFIQLLVFQHQLEIAAQVASALL